MGQTQSQYDEMNANHLTDWRGYQQQVGGVTTTSSSSSSPPPFKRPPQRQHVHHTTPSPLHSSILPSSNDTNTVGTIQQKALPAVVISARPIASTLLKEAAPTSSSTSSSQQHQFHPQQPPLQPYLPHSAATLSYLDSLLSKAEALTDVHRKNVKIVTEQLKTIQEENRERLEEEGKRREEEQKQQTMMKSEETDAAEEENGSISQHFAKRARLQLLEETQSLYVASLQEKAATTTTATTTTTTDEASLLLGDPLPSPPVPSPSFTTAYQSYVNINQDASAFQQMRDSSPERNNNNDDDASMLSEDLFGIMNPINLCPELTGFDDEEYNETGLIGGQGSTGPGPAEHDDNNTAAMFLNQDAMAELEEIFPASPSPPSSTESDDTSPTQPSSTTIDDRSATSSLKTPTKSVMDAEITAWKESSVQLRKISSKFKNNFQKIDALAVLERAFQSGLITIDVLTQYLSFMQVMLEHDDHEELMKQFREMNLKNDNVMISSAAAASSDDIASRPSPSIRPPTAISVASAMLPVYVDDLIPEECAPDDADGVCRMRILMRYTTSLDETYQQLQKEREKRRNGGTKTMMAGGSGRKQKRKQADYAEVVDDDHIGEIDADTETITVNNDIKILIKPEHCTQDEFHEHTHSETASPSGVSAFATSFACTLSNVLSSSNSSSAATASSASSIASSTTTPRSPNPVVYRIAWFNAAFERTFGYTQKQQKEEFALIGQRIIFKFVRSDHIAAFHYILTKMKFEGKTETHMYQVRMTRDGREIYCLVHLRINSVRGKMMDGCQSIIPLPEEAQKDMPPFHEGVDLHEDVLRYGYKSVRDQAAAAEQQQQQEKGHAECARGLSA